MDILDEELLNLWKLFHLHSVEYIVVGGFAVNLYGHSRITDDLDLWIKDSPANRKKLRLVLEELNNRDFKSVETMDFIPGWSAIRMDSGFEIDIMTFMSGFAQEQFDDCFQYAETGLINEVPIRFLHYKHLIESKKAAGRPKDLLDIEELERINRQP